MTCSACGQVITSNRRADNRYRGCQPCGWRMHHGCWVELLSDADLPCPTVEVEAVLWKNGKVREPSYRETVEGHGEVMGMRGEWEM